MKYIPADKLKALIKRQIRWENLNFAALGGGGQTFCINTLEWILKQIDSFQEQPEVQNGKFVFPKYLYARTKDNKTIDMSYVPQDMTAVEYIRNDFVEQEQPEKSKKDCNGCPHCVDRKDQSGWHFKGCFGGPYKGKFIAEIDECPLKQEQTKVDLEKYIENEINHYGLSLYEASYKTFSASEIDRIIRNAFELGLKAKEGSI